jgi:hypothetical protein
LEALCELSGESRIDSIVCGVTDQGHLFNPFKSGKEEKRGS